MGDMHGDKLKALNFILGDSGSEVLRFKLLTLVDLQGIYLGLHRVLSGLGFPVNSGVVLGKFALLQIDAAAREVSRRYRGGVDGDTASLDDLFDSILIEYVDGRPFLKGSSVKKGCSYISLDARFEIFYALPDLREMEWRLKKEAKFGRVSGEQLDKMSRGVVSRPGIFDRDYRFYSDFVDVVKSGRGFSGEGVGFFSYSYGANGLKYFDEKEVDSRLVMSATKAVLKKDADVVCVISSDQDFLPLMDECSDVGVGFYQADMAKFTSEDNIGRRLLSLGDSYIAGFIRPEWPISIISECISSSGGEVLDREELEALALLHNQMNEVKVKFVVDGSVARVELYRPVGGDVEFRTDPKSGMLQVGLNRIY